MPGSQEKVATNSGGASQMATFGNIGTEASEVYDMIKPLSKKSFEEDTKPIHRKEVKQLDLEWEIISAAVVV